MSAADRYIRHVLYQGTLQQRSSPKFSYQTHVTDISIGRTRTLSGGENKAFADRLIGRDSAGRTLPRVKNKREIQGQNESCVKSSFIGFSLLCRKNLLSGVKREEKRNETERKEDK